MKYAKSFTDLFIVYMASFCFKIYTTTIKLTILMDYKTGLLFNTQYDISRIPWGGVGWRGSSNRENSL